MRDAISLRAAHRGMAALSRPASQSARDAAAAVLSSRLVIWCAGAGAFLVHGANDPRVPHVGPVRDALLAPVSRWDAVHLQLIAEHGYSRGSSGFSAKDLTAFFPGYPLAARAAGELFGSLLLGGVLVSMAALVAALVLLHRLTELDLGTSAARRTVLLVAFFPTAVFLSAFYSESLFLALSVGSIYAGRRGRWAIAGALGAFASVTRNTGVLLVVPLLLLYLYGPRADRGDGTPTGGRGWRPRYPLRADALWIAVVPAGLLAFCAFTWIRFGDPLATFHAQVAWHRSLGAPLSAVWYAIPKTVEAAGELFTDSHDPFESPTAKLMLFGALALAIVAIVGVFRSRLPSAYGVYAALALAAPLSNPIPAPPLMSLPRFIAVIFPIQMWLAIKTERPARFAIVLGVLAAMCVVLTAKFAIWDFAG